MRRRLGPCALCMDGHLGCLLRLKVHVRWVVSVWVLLYRSGVQVEYTCHVVGSPLGPSVQAKALSASLRLTASLFRGCGVAAALLCSVQGPPGQEGGCKARHRCGGQGGGGEGRVGMHAPWMMVGGCAGTKVAAAIWRRERRRIVGVWGLWPRRGHTCGVMCLGRAVWCFLHAQCCALHALWMPSVGCCLLSCRVGLLRRTSVHGRRSLRPGSQFLSEFE